MAAGLEVTDHRYFIRTIIRHSDFVTKEASFEYMEKEGERMFLEAIDQLEVAFNNPDVCGYMCCWFFVVYLLLFVYICYLLFVSIIIFQSTRTDCNHIFLHFVPPIIMDPKKVQ